MQTLFKLLTMSLLWLCMTAQAASPAGGYSLEFLPPPDPDDGLTYRVLCLHDVRDNLRSSFGTNPDPYAIDTRTLVDIFEWLRAKEFHPVSMSQIVEARNGGKPLPPKPVLLTFDDGLVSGYTKVFPLLKQFNYPAVFALVTRWVDMPDTDTVPISAKVTLTGKDFLNWEQVREMSESNLVEFASHSHNLHRGIIANPQNNEKPAASFRIYDKATQTYETFEEFRARLRADLAESIRLIEQHTGKRPRIIAWPYGAQNRHSDDVARELGLDVMLTLRPGPNTPDVPLNQVRRILLNYEVTVGQLTSEMRQPMTHAGILRPVQRIVQVDLDYVYDPDPAQQERNLSLLIDRIKDLKPSTVYLQAFADETGTGDVTSVYFPNRHMPVRADLFGRVAWQLRTRADVQVFAWMPVLTFSLPKGHPAYGRVVQSSGRAEGERGLGNPTRLSPYDPTVRQVIAEIYEDLAATTRFEGILFHDDAVLDSTEDASPPALQTYASWGLPQDLEAIRKSPELNERWVRGKTRHLIDFTHELTDIVNAYQHGETLLTVRNLYARPVLEPKAEGDFSQNLDDFLLNYDYVALMAMPYMEKAEDPGVWLKQLVEAVAAKKGLPRTIFELQAMDWRAKEPVDSQELLGHMQTLRSMGAVHYGYYPDDFISNHPNVEVLREAMSLKQSLEVRKLPPLQEAARQLVLGLSNDTQVR